MQEQAKSVGEELRAKLLLDPKNGGLILSEQEVEKAFAFCEGYKTYLDDGKTEHEVVLTTIKMLEEKGFKAHVPGTKYAAGDKIYYNNRGKALLAAVIGSKSLAEGLRIVAAHIDSPRLDLKPNPLYEQADLGYLKTHYYGGVKKYQWAAIPLALHGTVVRKDGSVLDIAIGEDESDPVFYITDLLPHLAQEQMKRTLAEGIKGEELNILLGSLPFRDEKISEKVKLNIANIIFEKYGMVEEDFRSAELEVVPCFKARDVGFDRSMVAAYGHDDRVCAYPAIIASMEVEHPAYTTVSILADKEEVGSIGATGMQGCFFEYLVADLAEANGLTAREVFRHSQCLSADVGAAFDPTFPDVYEKNNSCYINRGTTISKYTGSRGKSGSNDATAYYMGKIRKMLEDNQVLWQVGELGKVDAGGGGTVALIISKLDVDTVDIGVPVLSMHAPYEVVSKIDVYSTYRACKAFYEDK